VKIVPRRQGAAFFKGLPQNPPDDSEQNTETDHGRSRAFGPKAGLHEPEKALSQFRKIEGQFVDPAQNLLIVIIRLDIHLSEKLYRGFVDPLVDSDESESGAYDFKQATDDVKSREFGNGDFCAEADERPNKCSGYTQFPIFHSVSPFGPIWLTGPPVHEPQVVRTGNEAINDFCPSLSVC